MRSSSLAAALVLALVLLPACGDSGTPDASGAKSSSAASGAGDAASGSGGNKAENPSITPESLKPKSLLARVKSAEDDAIRYLRSYQDPKTGAVGVAKPVNEKTRHPGITAMAVLGYIESNRGYGSEDGPFVRNALDYLAGLQKEDGSIYENDSANYVTSLALMALQASGEERFKETVERARDYLVRLQATEDQGYKKDDKFYGGVGYGSSQRPDLSNTQFAIEAVHRAGLEEGHPFYEAAIQYLQRCQNLSEVNDQVAKDADGNEIRPGNDGGAFYAPGESKAGVTELSDGSRVFLSYGSMSYALLKSYLFCGLDRRDRRVKAVVDWTRKNFDLERHPGFAAGAKGDEPYQGMYYYYLSMARTLGAMGEESFVDGAGVERKWAVELAEKLLSLQNPDDGSFVNEKNPRWQEGFRVLATSYALLALEECRRTLEKSGR
ncbi:MAG: prenyltransferase/squalene oxidase repeat-containing protein [Planctomycetota bacterium]